MTKNLLLGFAVGAALLVGSSSQALMFTNIKRDGLAYSNVSAIGGPNLSNAAGIAYNLSNFSAFSGSSKTTTLTYTVTAGAGEQITSYNFAPNGYVKNATVAGLITHSSTDIYTATSAGYATLGGTSNFLLGSTYNVSIVLSATSLTGASFASVSNLGMSYTTVPVPEPTSMGVLALGIAGLVARRRKGSK